MSREQVKPRKNRLRFVAQCNASSAFGGEAGPCWWSGIAVGAGGHHALTQDGRGTDHVAAGRP
jgi:hypothetical protein